VLKNRKLHCPEKRCHSFCSYISDNFASDFVVFGMLHRNGPSMQVGKYFSCLLGNAVPNNDIIVTSQQRSIRRWRRRLSACVQADGGHFEHHF